MLRSRLVPALLAASLAGMAVHADAQEVRSVQVQFKGQDYTVAWEQDDGVVRPRDPSRYTATVTPSLNSKDLKRVVEAGTGCSCDPWHLHYPPGTNSVRVTIKCVD